MVCWFCLSRLPEAFTYSLSRSFSRQPSGCAVFCVLTFTLSKSPCIQAGRLSRILAHHLPFREPPGSLLPWPDADCPFSPLCVLKTTFAVCRPVAYDLPAIGFYPPLPQLLEMSRTFQGSAFLLRRSSFSPDA